MRLQVFRFLMCSRQIGKNWFLTEPSSWRIWAAVLRDESTVDLVYPSQGPADSAATGAAEMKEFLHEPGNEFRKGLSVQRS